MYRRLETRIWNLSALRQVLRRGTGASPSLSSGRRVCSGILPAAVNLARKSISLTLIGPRSLWTSTVDPRDVSGIRFAFNFLRRMRTRRGRGIIYHASPTRLVENLSVDRPPLLGDDVDLLVGRVPLLSSPPFIYIHIYTQSETKSSTDYRARWRRGTEEAARVKSNAYTQLRYIFSG